MVDSINYWTLLVNGCLICLNNVYFLMLFSQNVTRERESKVEREKEREREDILTEKETEIQRQI